MEVVTEAEQQEIIAWANQNYTTFQPSGEFRQFKLIENDATDIPACIFDIKKRIIEQEHLENITLDSKYDLVSYILPGGKVNPHTVPVKDNLVIIRFVVFIQLPDTGGLPLIDDVVIPVSERTYTRLDLSAGLHSSQVVEGTKARIAISFGFLIPQPAN
jgi:hypothetical protein